MTKEKILITGGAGFIGAHLTKQLIKKFDVTILDQDISERSSLFAMGLVHSPRVHLVRGDITDANLWDSFAQDFQVIIHAAGMLGVKKVTDHPYQTMTINGIGTYNALEFALKQKSLRRFINFSTSEIYGPSSLNVNEELHAVLPSHGRRWGYAASKFFGEYLARSAFYEHDLPTVTVRPFNVYGPFRMGENGMGRLIVNALNDEAITIIGSGEQRRAWCHVTDFAKGVVACIDGENIDGESFNIGNDENCPTMNELASYILQATQSHSHILHTADSDDISERKPNIDKARKFLNYRPQISVHEGIWDMVQHLKAA